MYHSFMVRIWQEAESIQITVESVQSGQVTQFDNLTSLLEFLHNAVDSDISILPRQDWEECD